MFGGVTPDGCLSDQDVDTLTSGMVAWPSALLVGSPPAARALATAKRSIATAMLSRSTSLLAVIHFRHHWVAARVAWPAASTASPAPPVPSWEVWDSAPSRAVRADAGRLARLLGLPPPSFPPAPRQPRGSNACGLFASAAVVAVSAGLPGPPLSLCAAALRAAFGLSVAAFRRVAVGAPPAPSFSPAAAFVTEAKNRLAAHASRPDAQREPAAVGGTARRPVPLPARFAGPPPAATPPVARPAAPAVETPDPTVARAVAESEKLALAQEAAQAARTLVWQQLRAIRPEEIFSDSCPKCNTIVSTTQRTQLKNVLKTHQLSVNCRKAAATARQVTPTTGELSDEEQRQFLMTMKKRKPADIVDVDAEETRKRPGSPPRVPSPLPALPGPGSAPNPPGSKEKPIDIDFLLERDATGRRYNERELTINEREVERAKVRDLLDVRRREAQAGQLVCGEVAEYLLREVLARARAHYPDDPWLPGLHLGSCTAVDFRPLPEGMHTLVRALHHNTHFVLLVVAPDAAPLIVDPLPDYYRAEAEAAARPLVCTGPLERHAAAFRWERGRGQARNDCAFECARSLAQFVEKRLGCPPLFKPEEFSRGAAIARCVDDIGGIWPDAVACLRVCGRAQCRGLCPSPTAPRPAAPAQPKSGDPKQPPAQPKTLKSQPKPVSPASHPKPHGTPSAAKADVAKETKEQREAREDELLRVLEKEREVAVVPHPTTPAAVGCACPFRQPGVQGRHCAACPLSSSFDAANRLELGAVGPPPTKPQLIGPAGLRLFARRACAARTGTEPILLQICCQARPPRGEPPRPHGEVESWQSVVGRVHPLPSAPNDFSLEAVAVWCAVCRCWGPAEPGELVLALPCSSMLYAGAVLVDENTFVAELQPGCCACDEGDTDVPEPETSPLAGTAMREFLAELKADASLGWTTADGLQGSVASKWFLYGEKPPHVPSLTWKSLAASTRAAHVRWLRLLVAAARHPDERHASLPTLVVTVVLREAATRRWTSWATIASALSAVGSALARLPQYTNQARGIDLRGEPGFADAAKRARHLAKVTARWGTADAMTVEQLRAGLAATKSAPVRLFLKLLWLLAARAGDLRQVDPADIVLEPAPPSSGQPASDSEAKQLLKITFRRGKGAAFWGPYTVAAMIDDRDAQLLAAHTAAIKAAQPTRDRQAGEHIPLFSTAEQQALSAVVGAIPAGSVAEPGLQARKLNLRAVRRGRLQALAADGCSNEELRLLSGHRREDTLLRYLGWGRWSASAAAAAASRQDKEDQQLPSQGSTIGGGVGGGRDPLEPPKMGPWSGRAGQSGRRIRTPPSGLPLKAPSSRDLGLSPNGHLPPHMWPLKARCIPVVDLPGKIRQALVPTGNTQQAFAAKAQADLIELWLSDQPMRELLDGRPDFEMKEIPTSAITRADLNALDAAGKQAALGEKEKIRGWASAHIVLQHAKEQRRQVVDCEFNRHYSEFPRGSYPPRRCRRYLRRHPFFVDFDFAQFFDQLGLSPEAQLWYVIHYLVDEEDGTQTHALRKLTRLPMGARHAPGIAQTLTDLIIEAIAEAMGDEVKIFSMIDNVRIAASSAEALLTAVRMFLDRCERAGVVLNDVEWPVDDRQVEKRPIQSMSDEDWVLLSQADHKVFLGEQYNRTSVRNAPRTVDKLRDAYALFLDAAAGRVPKYSYRNLVSLMGLTFWMLHTLDVHLVDLYETLRSYARLSTRAGHDGWDTPLQYISESIQRNLEPLVALLLDNDWCILPEEPTMPSQKEADYDVIITIDASHIAWAALVFFPHSGTEVCLKQGWWGNIHFSASTVAEPSAISRCLTWLMGPGSERLPPHLRNNPQLIKTAVITDHQAVVTGQRRWWSGNGGFSDNPFLNEALSLLHQCNAVAFHIPGDKNPADGPSRCFSGPDISVTVTSGQVALPTPLSELSNPYIFTKDTDPLLLPKMTG